MPPYIIYLFNLWELWLGLFPLSNLSWSIDTKCKVNCNVYYLDIEGLSVLPYGQKECDYNKYHFESMLVTKTQAIELAPPKCVQ